VPFSYGVGILAMCRKLQPCRSGPLAYTPCHFPFTGATHH